MTLAKRCVGVAVGLLLDRALGDPPNSAHPVAWFGTAMGRVESAIWDDHRLNGAAYAAAGIALGGATGALVRSTAAMVAITASGRQLRRTAGTIGDIVETGDLEAARSALPALVGRDPRELDAAGIRAAVIESLAENSVDAMVATAFWGLAGGAAGAGAYRAINTMDAMVGHRSERYEQFGWAAARIDDVANYLPARAFAILVAIHSPGRAREILAAVRGDAPAHPSPNAGVAEAAVAAAVGCELGGPLRYGERIENRPALGDGPRPQPGDVQRVIELVDRIERSIAAAVAVVGVVLARRRANG